MILEVQNKSEFDCGVLHTALHSKWTAKCYSSLTDIVNCRLNIWYYVTFRKVSLSIAWLIHEIVILPCWHSLIRRPGSKCSNSGNYSWIMITPLLVKVHIPLKSSIWLETVLLPIQHVQISTDKVLTVPSQILIKSSLPGRISRVKAHKFAIFNIFVP